MKIKKYLNEKVIQSDPIKKKAFNEYKKAYGDIQSVLKSLKNKVDNHQKRFLAASKLDLNYIDDIKYLYKELKDLNGYFD